MTTLDILTDAPERKILAIAGNVITIDPLGPMPGSTPGPTFRDYVSDVTRNVSFRSEDATQIDRRGHVMFMENPDVQIANAGFYDLGRTLKTDVPVDDTVVTNGQVTHLGTNPRGRYPLHFHMTGTDMSTPPATVVGCAIVGSPGWGLVNHSSYVSADDNVIYGAVSGMVGETGNEVGDFTHNLIIHMIGNTDEVTAVQDWGRVGNGIFMTGPGIKVVSNIINDVRNTVNPWVGSAIEINNYGYMDDGVRVDFDAKNLSDPSIAKGRTSVSTSEVPAYIVGNEGFVVCAGIGLVWGTAGSKNLFANDTFWWVSVGVQDAYNSGYTLTNSTIIGSPFSSQALAPTGLATLSSPAI